MLDEGSAGREGVVSEWDRERGGEGGWRRKKGKEAQFPRPRLHPWLKKRRGREGKGGRG